MKNLICIGVALLFIGCGAVPQKSEVTSMSGVRETTTQVKTGSDGLTSEQRNIKHRLEMDNKPGAIKHLYVFSAYSGQCILYSTVKEKVTSSGKRLSPTTVYASYAPNSYRYFGSEINLAGTSQLTTEVLQDDGTYGSSIDYLYWFDERGVYHQHYVQGGQIVHVSNEPMPVKSIILNIEAK